MECLFARGKESTDFASPMPVYINNCGYWRQLDKNVTVNRPNGRADYHLLFNVSGEIAVDGETLGEGEAYLIMPREGYEYIYMSRPNSFYYWLHFSGTEVSSILERFSIGRGKYSLSESRGEVEEILRRMVKALLEEWEGAEDYMVGQLYSLLTLLSAPRRNKNPFLKAVKKLCDPNDKTTVADLAESYGMSEGHFIRQFKMYTGQTPLGYRSLKRVEMAKSLLVGTDMSVTDISESLGVEDTHYFSRVFKRHVGVSPREYRNKYL